MVWDLVGKSHLDILSTSTAFSRRFFIRSLWSGLMCVCRALVQV